MRDWFEWVIRVHEWTPGELAVLGLVFLLLSGVAIHYAVDAGAARSGDFKEDRRPMRILAVYIARLSTRWIDWRARRRDLTPEQIAAWMRESWEGPPAYRVTYPADPVLAEETAARAGKAYVARHRGWFATASGPVTAKGYRWWRRSA